MEYVLHKLKFKNKLNYWQKIAEDWQGYYRHTMFKNRISLEVYCGANINLATNLGVMALSEVYKLDGDFDMEIKFGSWKKFWL